MQFPHLVALVLCITPSSAFGQVEREPADRTREEERVAGWRSDIDYLVREAQTAHAGPERPAFSEGFLDHVARLRLGIPELSNDQVHTSLMKLLAILNDGHTALHGPRSDTKLEFTQGVLPFKFYWFPSGIYVVSGAGEWADYAGSQVLQFGELPAEEVLSRMSAYRGVDNDMMWTWVGPQFYLGQLSLLREVGVAVEQGAVRVLIRTAEGEQRSLEVAGGEHRHLRKLRPFPFQSGEPPLYLSSVDTNYWIKSMPEHGAVYVQFNQVRDAPLESLAAFSERLRQTLTTVHASNLIVDVRHNNGGNNTLLRPLVRAMIEFEMRSPEHKLFVLMGRNTFSAAQNFINRVERWTSAVFVGESSSSCPNFVGESNEFVLPFSRLEGSISNLYWQDSDPWDRRKAIAVNLPVVLTAEQYFEGIDPVLELVLGQL